MKRYFITGHVYLKPTTRHKPIIYDNKEYKVYDIVNMDDEIIDFFDCYTLEDVRLDIENDTIRIYPGFFQSNLIIDRQRKKIISAFDYELEEWESKQEEIDD